MKVLHILLLIFVLIGFANAQDSVLSGTVFGVSSKALPNVKISAIDKNLEITETISDSNGKYTIKLRSGVYTLEFVVENYKRTKVSGFQVNSGENLQFDTKLEGGGLICALPMLMSSDRKVTVRGTVTDELDAVLPNSKVELKLNTKGVFIAYSDENGDFRIEIPKGTYKISISAESFKKIVLKNQVIDSESKCFTFKLKSNIPPHQIT
jgi:phosphatidate phosphatase APP1